MDYFVGIDQSYRNTGIFILDHKGEPVKFEVVQTLKDDGDYFTRSQIAADSITNFISSFDEYSDAEVIHVGIEGLAFSLRGSTLQTLAGLQYVIVNSLRQEGYDPQVYTPSAVKKSATGSGKATKDDMWNILPERVKKMLEGVPKAHGKEDLADAYAIAWKRLKEYS